MSYVLAPVLFLLTMAFSASAAELTKRVESSPREKNEARAIQARFGDCVVKKRYAAARIFVLTPEFEKDSDWRRAVDKVADGHCLIAAAASAGGVTMTFPSDTMRYALADALVRKEFFQKVPPSLRDAGPIAQPGFDETKCQPKPGKKTKKKESDELAENRAKRLALVYLAQYGECVVRADSAQSRTLLLAAPDTPEESSAFSALKPSLGSCVIEGQSVKFNKVTLRGTIAMNFYRLAQAPLPATTTDGAPK